MLSNITIQIINYWINKMNANAILDSESPDSNLEQSTVPIKYSFINQGSYKKSKSPYLNSFLSSKESRENKFFTSKSSEYFKNIYFYQ